VIGDERSVTSSGGEADLATDRSPMSVPTQPSWQTFSSLAACGCSCASLVISFLGLAQFDLPVVRYVRSVTIHLPWDQLTVPWMAFTSDTGDWIGQGWHLTAFSILLLAVAWAFEKSAVTMAAIQSLIAHGIAAVSANGLKHLISRPRPKFTHSGDWQMSVSLASGWDSFPSGHSTASFAVATVLAKRFPVFGPLCIGVATFVALSRVLRGSHFPTDVVGGAALGILSGSLGAAPFKQWRTSFQDGLRHAAIGASMVLALLWALSHRMDDGVVGTLFLVLGAGAILGGLWLRRVYWLRRDELRNSRPAIASALLIVYGLAALTTSPLALSSVGFACLASWLHTIGQVRKCEKDSAGWSLMRESVLLGGVILAVLILVDVRGVLPFQ
jgi:membrane-associated phospholipid phosphatase